MAIIYFDQLSASRNDADRKRLIDRKYHLSYEIGVDVMQQLQKKRAVFWNAGCHDIRQKLVHYQENALKPLEMK